MTDFFRRYSTQGSEDFLASSPDSPAAFFSGFINLATKTKERKLYVIIDEYDHFANAILSKNKDLFKSITGDGGFVKNFYSRLKRMYDTGKVSKIFITGVTKISLDSMTSGFSIANDISRRPEFATICGFTEDEVKTLVPQCRHENCPLSETAVFERMKDYYNGYRFSPDAGTPSVFNSSMCLWYLDSLLRYNNEPAELFDPASNNSNQKLDAMFDLAPKKLANSIIHDVIKGNDIPYSSFPGLLNLNQHDIFNSQEVLAALFYLGYLTFAPSASNFPALKYVIPNKAMRRQFFDYWLQNDQKASAPLSELTLRPAFDAMKQGNINPYVEFFANCIQNAFGLHVLTHFDESNLQSMMVMTGLMTPDYRVQAEREAFGKGFSDLLFSPTDSSSNHCVWLVELKYLKKSEDSAASRARICSKMQEQLARYAESPDFQTLHHFKRAGLLFVGLDLVELVLPD